MPNSPDSTDNSSSNPLDSREEGSQDSAATNALANRLAQTAQHTSAERPHIGGEDDS